MTPIIIAVLVGLIVIFFLYYVYRSSSSENFEEYDKENSHKQQLLDLLEQREELPKMKRQNIVEKFEGNPEPDSSERAPVDYQENQDGGCYAKQKKKETEEFKKSNCANTQCTHDAECEQHSGLITTYGDYPAIPGNVYFRPRGNMGDNAISKFGVLPTSQEYHPLNDTCNRIYTFASPIEKCSNPNTDDIRRNYPEMISLIRGKRNDEYNMNFKVM